MVSDVTIYYAGFNLTEKMDLDESPDFGILPDVENVFLDQTKNDGKRFKYKRNEGKSIPLSFLMSTDDYIADRDTLALILNQETPQQLQISIFKDRYWNAIIDGSSSFVREMNDKNQVRISLSFYVPEGIAHATKTDIYTTQSDTFTVNNKGTYKSYPILEATMPGDNGVVAFINNRGKILQFGNPDEADGVGYTESDRVIWDTVMIASAEASRGWKTNEYQFDGLWNGTEKLNANGTRKFGSDGGYGFVTPDSYGTGTQGFKGITYGRKVSPDSQGHVGAKDFESRHGVWFETGNIRQTGIYIVELRDASGKAVCSVTFYKLSSSNNNAKIRINVKGNWKEWSFQPTAWNFYTKKGREFSIVKEGNLLRFHVGGVANGGFIHSIRLDELKDVEVTDVVYYMGVPVNGTPLSHMKLTHSTFRKDKVEKVRDVKNLFGEADVLRADCSTGIVTLNGIEQKGLGSLGNDWEEFFLEPGINQIECIYSSWAQAPSFKLYNQEVYL